MLNVFLSILLIGLLWSCSTSQMSPVTPENSSPSKSILTPPELSAEDHEREQALQRYREMRAQDWDRYIKKKKTTVERPPRNQEHIIPPTQAPLLAPLPTPTTPMATPLNEAGQDPDSEIIADQKIRFHCSARTTIHEKDKFERCLMQTQEIWNNCKRDELSTRKALFCLKQKL
ncbi:MAG: hypothetical protein AABY86_05625 [Bdellovibrionota bacterium]